MFDPKKRMENHVSLNFITFLGITKWSVLFMGTKENAKKYSYKLEFPKAQSEDEYYDISKSITWKSPCYILPDDDGEKFSGHNYVMIHRYVHIIIVNNYNIIVMNVYASVSFLGQSAPVYNI